MDHKVKIEESIEIKLLFAKVRYYLIKNSLIQGVFLLLKYLLPLYLSILTVDIIFEFSSITRYIVLILISIILIYFLFKYILLPAKDFVLKQNNFSEYEISRLFLNVEGIDDKLLTYVELKDKNIADSIVKQAIEVYNTKIKNVSPSISQVSFISIRSLDVIISILITILFITSQLVHSYQIAQKRIIFPGYKLSYQKLDINVLNKEFSILEGSDFIIEIKAVGSYVPKTMYVNQRNSDYIASKINDSIWNFRFDNVRQSSSFYVHDGINQSKTFFINVIQIPKLVGFEIEIIPPKYTEIKKFSVQQNGNFSFPEGSDITFNIKSAFCSKAFIIVESDTIELEKSREKFSLTKKALDSFNYEIVLFNDTIQNNDRYYYSALVLKDKYPTISINQNFDNLNFLKPILFSGEIVDDFGFTSLNMILKLNDSVMSVNLPFSKRNLKQNFFYEVTLTDIITLTDAKRVSIYFEVTDNDQINGYKKSTSEILEIKIPDKEEIVENQQLLNDSLQDKLNLGLQLIKQLGLERSELEKRLKTENLTEWERKQYNEQFERNINEMNNLIQQVKNLSEQLKSFTNFDKTTDNTIREKYNEIQKLLDKLLDQEMIELLSALDKLQKEAASQKQNKKSDIAKDLEQIQKMLDRNLELLRRYEVEKGIDDIARQLKNNADKLEIVQSSEERENIEEKIKSLLEGHDEILKKNKELKKPFEIDSFEGQKKDLEQSLKSNDNQKNDDRINKRNSTKTKNLAEMIQADFKNKNEKSEAEDLQNLRQLRSNLLNVSYAQENIVLDGMSRKKDKNVKSNFVQQKLVLDKWKIIEDSLFALSSRNPLIGQLMDEEMKNINSLSYEIARNWMEEYPKSMVVTEQKILNHLNNLLLYIDEAIQKAEESLNSTGSGNGCPKPGKGKPSPGDMAKQQQGLKNQLKKMIEELKKAKETGDQDGSGISESLGRFLSQQEMMQKMIQDMLAGQEIGNQTRELLKEVNKMLEENINDIVNKRLTNETFLRHERIITRLLESEKAEKEQKFEEKRTSKENTLDFSKSVRAIDSQDIDKQSIYNQQVQKMIILNKYYLDLYQIYMNTGR